MSKRNIVPVIFDKVSKFYGDVKAVDNISFEIEAGHLVTLLGPSGCGKTTTLRMVAGLEMASSGKIIIGDRDVTQIPASQRSVAMVFQSYALFPHMSVLQNVGYGLKVSGKSAAEIKEAAENGLELVGLKGYGDRFPNELSGPEVLLFDEPLSNLDAKLRRRVREDIRELQQRLGLTSVYVTHDQEEALAISDNIIVLKDGIIAQHGTPRDLYESPKDEFVADFIGNANVVNGEIFSLKDKTAMVNIGGVEIELPHRNLSVGNVKIAIHPRAITIKSVDSDLSALKGSVDKANYLGGHMEYMLNCSLGDLFVINHQIHSPVIKGESVNVGFDKQGVSLINNV